jgi:hypothetical protein
MKKFRFQAAKIYFFLIILFYRGFSCFFLSAIRTPSIFLELYNLYIKEFRQTQEVLLKNLEFRHFGGCWENGESVGGNTVDYLRHLQRSNLLEQAS